MPIVMITEAAAAFELGNSKNPFYTSHLILFHALFSVLILILDLHYYTTRTTTSLARCLLLVLTLCLATALTGGI